MGGLVTRYYLRYGRDDVLDRDFFDAKIWQCFEWAIFNPETRDTIITEKGESYYNLLAQYFNKQIERACRFAWSLSVPTAESPVRYIIFWWRLRANTRTPSGRRD